MWPFDSLNNQNEQDMAKALDHIADGGWKMKKGLVKPSKSSASVTEHGRDPGDERGHQQQAKSKSATTPNQAATAKAGASAKHEASADGTPTPMWEVKGYITKKGVKGKIVKVGPFSAFLPDGDEEKEQACFDAINKVFRSDEAKKLADAFSAK